MKRTVLNKLSKACVLVLASLPLTLLAESAYIQHVETQNFSDHVRVVFQVSHLHGFTVFTLPNPNRVVLDINKGVLETRVSDLELSKFIIKRVRSGHHQNGTLRIVLDATTNVQVKDVVNDVGSDKAIVLDIYSREASMPVSSIQVEQVAPVETAKPVEARPVVSKEEALPITKKISKPTPVLQTQATSAVVISAPTKSTSYFSELFSPKKKTHVAQLTSSKSRRIIVVIDAGHGGKDTGTIGVNGTKEKDVVLAIATRLAELMAKDPNIEPVLTRDGDYFVPLHERLSIARRSKADLFIAIHADSYFNNKQRGASVYALSHHGATSEAARWLADKENHSEVGGVNLNGLDDKNPVLRSVLLDLAQAATNTDSMTLGADILASLKNTTKLHCHQVELAPFVVLKSPDIPSILVETGFLSNPQEEERLREEPYRDRMALSLLDGVHHYIDAHPMMMTSVKTSVPLEV